jgi:hypothetical protein
MINFLNIIKLNLKNKNSKLNFKNKSKKSIILIKSLLKNNTIKYVYLNKIAISFIKNNNNNF